MRGADYRRAFTGKRPGALQGENPGFPLSSAPSANSLIVRARTAEPLSGKELSFFAPRAIHMRGGHQLSLLNIKLTHVNACMIR
ncbi:MAG: hypothetical protein A2270_02690 [Elusimicrobia bacterium RIFOXYA12_FULL_51_18]|nr:MAG: hypothetical protein A2270_02690 [Elusimicrobia bacterium RIFOXYA12_FULL_51_18]OGS32220.1 MAG: hypothetical protein A2218_04870 [Elusimicrobia bacterium RIFOXYA2_FULL_53_38]